MLKSDMENIKNRFKNNDLVCEKIIHLFSLISNKIRFRILCLLLEGDFCVSEIVDIIQIGKMSNVSQQLKLLTMAGIIEKHRNKKQIFYHLKNEEIKQIINHLHTNYLNREKNCEEDCDSGSGNSRNNDGEPSLEEN